MNAMTDSTPYSVPQEPGRWRALTFAALVHAALLAFLWIGVRWQSDTPTTIEAEVWNPQPREAAPVPEPVKAPEPKPEPRPEPKPVVQEPPKPKVVEPPVAKPDIALEQEKKRKAEEKKRREEEEEKEEKLAKEKKRLEDEKLAKEKKRREDEEKVAKLKQEEAKRLEKEKAEKAEVAKKLAAEKKRQAEADDKLAQKMRDEEMRRVTGAGGSGDAAKAQGGRADGAYSQRIAAKIRSNITFIVPEGLQGNPPVEYEVRLLPDGSVAGLRKLRSSGVPGFDDAVARAIERAQPFPKDSSGSVPSTFIGNHKPKDQ